MANLLTMADIQAILKLHQQTHKGVRTIFHLRNGARKGDITGAIKGSGVEWHLNFCNCFSVQGL
jgi:hypothetical protein